MFDLVIFGATGHTAAFILEEIATCKALPAGFSWAIAGRNVSSLKARQRTLEGKLAPTPEVLVADISDEILLLEMARQAKAVINCVGPFRLVGEPVVRACIEGHANYLDICGEPEFIERTHLKYHDKAAKAGVTIINAAAFDSVPCDLGVLEIKRAFAEKGAVPSSVEMFFRMQTAQKFGVHSTTFDSAVYGFGGGHAELVNIRRELSRIRPAPKPTGPPPPKPRVGLFGTMQDPRVQGYLIPYMTADPVVVNMSQYIEPFLNPEGPSSPSVHFSAYMVLPTLYTFLVFKAYFAVFKWLVARRWGRALLLKHPKLLTNGIASKEGPSAEQRAHTTFSQTFFGKGFSSDAVAHSAFLRPDVSMKARIDGGEVGYVVTPLIIVKCALAMARLEANGGEKLKRGVLTPAVVFHDARMLDEVCDGDPRMSWVIEEGVNRI
ncbi:Saccharopine dehydrogenase-domain-containing protein [Mycena vitilis]|nr:Saccharopine dehydrogenase-domain-containing protein [Mycena vitilis]